MVVAVGVLVDADSAMKASNGGGCITKRQLDSGQSEENHGDGDVVRAEDPPAVGEGPFVQRNGPAQVAGRPVGAGQVVYRYFSDRNDTYNGLRIEIQVRSRLQHAWATAVETVGLFTQQALKSSRGTEDWLRFFALMSSELARIEGTAIVPGTPDDQAEAVKELRRLCTSLDVVNRLRLFGATLNFAEDQSVAKIAKFFLLELNVPSGSLRLRSYNNALLAADAYNAIERASAEDPTTDVVLVSVDSQLRRAYPNYFLDTTVFVDAVQEVSG